MDNDILGMLGNTEKQAKPLAEEDAVPSDKMDGEVLKSMLTADGEGGNFTVKKKEQEEVPEKDKVIVKPGKVQEKLGKYSKEFMENVMKNPTKFTVETSRGKMTIKDAIVNGWNPKTGEFSDDNIKNNTKKHLDSLNDSDRKTVEKLVDPRNAGIAAADAEAIGMDAEDQMIRRPPEVMAQEEQGGRPSLTPEQIQKLSGGKA